MCVSVCVWLWWGLDDMLTVMFSPSVQSFRMIRTHIGQEDENICPDQSRCPPEFSCLRALTRFGCCPLAQVIKYTACNISIINMSLLGQEQFMRTKRLKGHIKKSNRDHQRPSNINDF